MKDIPFLNAKHFFHFYINGRNIFLIIKLQWKQIDSYQSFQTFSGVFQTFSGKHFPLISHFTPFWHLFKPLVEIISQNKSLQTFREFKVLKICHVKNNFSNLFFDIHEVFLNQNLKSTKKIFENFDLRFFSGNRLRSECLISPKNCYLEIN